MEPGSGCCLRRRSAISRRQRRPGDTLYFGIEPYWKRLAGERSSRIVDFAAAVDADESLTVSVIQPKLGVERKTSAHRGSPGAASRRSLARPVSRRRAGAATAGRTPRSPGLPGGMASIDAAD